MSGKRHVDRRHRRRAPGARPGRLRLTRAGRLSSLAAVLLLGAAGTAVWINRDEEAPAPATTTVDAAPVAAEVTLETSLWKSSEAVSGEAKSERTPLELGTRFTAARNGEVAGIRFYKPAGERGRHRGSLWDSKGRLLARVTFTDETRSGWQQAMFSTPVPIEAGRVYTVSYHTPEGGYVAAPGVFDRPVRSGPLTARAGVFTAAARSAFPSRVHRSKVSYFVDVVFRHRERRRVPAPAVSPTGEVVAEPTVVPATPTPAPSDLPTPVAESSGPAAASPSAVPPSAVSPTAASPSPEVEPSSPSPSQAGSPSPAPGDAPVSPSPSPVRAGASATPRVTVAEPEAQPSLVPDHKRGSFPSAADTGVPKGVTLKRSQSLTITKDGTVVDGLEVHGEINVEADNVTIRNTRVAAAPGDWGIIQRKGHSGLTVEHTEIFGNGRERTQFGILNQGGDITVRRVNIHTISNGILTEQGLVEDSYLHDPKYFPGDHTDMIMCTSGPPAGKSLVIRGNTVINTLEQTGAIALFQDFGVVRNVTVERNYLAGGGYSLYAGAGSKGTSSNIKIIDNVFGRDVWPKGGAHGPVAYWDRHGAGNVWKGNVWEDGKPVPEGG